MKSKIIMLAAGLSLGFIACNDGTTDTTKDTTTTTGTINTTSDNAANADNSPNVDVPVATRTSFETKYPKATNVRWNRYKVQDKTTMDASDWNYNLDTNDYEVVFNWDGADYYAWYDDGNWIRESSRVGDHSKLPAAVNDVIKKSYADYTITEVDKEHDKDRTVYEVDLEKGENKVKLTVDENGKIVKKKGKVDGKEIEKTKEEDKH